MDNNARGMRGIVFFSIRISLFSKFAIVETRHYERMTPNVLKPLSGKNKAIARIFPASLNCEHPIIL